MVNPVEQITAARRRLARIAAIRTGLQPVGPAIAAILAAALFTILGRITWERSGYVVDSPAAEALRIALVAVGLLALAAAGVAAWMAYRRADNFVAAAEQVDSMVGAHEEIVTLAILADPGNVERAREGRTPLFPVLWRRVIGYLDGFDAARAFKVEARRPLLRSLAMAGGVLMLTAGMTAALVRLPSPGEIQARKLRQIARALANSPDAIDRTLAAETMDAADSLENPTLPPEEKIARLDALKKDLEHEEQQNRQAASSSSASATGVGTGKSGGKGAGSGQGASNGNGKGKGNGSGNGNGNGSGPGAGTNQGGGGDKNHPQIAELKNEVADAQAQIQSASGDQSKAPSPSNKDGAGNALIAGKNPNKKGPSQEPGALAKANLPKPDAQATSAMAGGAGSGPKNAKGSSGDTHLGEMPASERFQRFYKVGDKGPPMALRDARYVLFRLPPEAPAGGAGPLVADTSRPTATVPYSNVPLKQNRLDVAPEEQQFIPPRYRDLIH